MNLPVMAPGLDRATFLAWCRGIDSGPFSTLAAGERVAFYNPDLIAAMGAAAAVTERVKLALTVLVAPMHDPVLVAKQVATLDVLSGGRVVLGLGVGGREEDYQAIGATFNNKRLTRTERAVARMREVWAQETIVAGAFPVGPEPVQKPGPQILSGSLMAKSIERAAKWADGLSTFDFGPSTPVVSFQINTAKRAWKEAGREREPYIQAACWYALGDDADDQILDYLGRYLRFLGPKMPASVAPMVRARSEESLKAVIAELTDLGVDELLLVPTSSAIDQLDRVAQLIG
jgi:alkanesulfonate monooxygenase SsuD/methylene tetrahydromethanopterin reductase-like flavin-dependent oxidoreductase (luciferase family)